MKWKAEAENRFPVLENSDERNCVHELVWAAKRKRSNIPVCPMAHNHIDLLLIYVVESTCIIDPSFLFLPPSSRRFAARTWQICLSLSLFITSGVGACPPQGHRTTLNNKSSRAPTRAFHSEVASGAIILATLFTTPSFRDFPSLSPSLSTSYLFLSKIFPLLAPRFSFVKPLE